MPIEQITVQPLFDMSILSVLVALIMVGVVLIFASLSRRLTNALASTANEINTVLSPSKHATAKQVMVFGVLLGILFIGISGVIYYDVYNGYPSMVSIGEGYITVDSTYFNRGLGVNGVVNVTSDNIVAAFVGQIGSGDFRLHKQHGFNSGDSNIGIYTLGNGARAYIASINATNLIIQLKSGEYLIVGTQDTQTLANSFVQKVHPLTS